MKALVIGGTGFIGYHVVLELLSGGHEASLIALPPIPDGLPLPAGVPVHLLSLDSTPDGQLVKLFAGFDAFVFAIGADDRTLPRKPAYPFFFGANVMPLVRVIRLARKAGMTSGVVMGSYFTHFNRRWPELDLEDRHPYIRSRTEQQRQGLGAAGKHFRLMFLELPFIFGSVPGRRSLWAPLVRYVNSRLPLLCPAGGTSAVSVKTVAAATVAALQHGTAGACFPVGEDNLTWEELFRKLMLPGNHERKIRRMSGFWLRSALLAYKQMNRLTGKESGLDFRYLADILLSKTFIDPLESAEKLKYTPAGLQRAFRDTLASERPGNDLTDPVV